MADSKAVTKKETAAAPPSAVDELEQDLLSKAKTPQERAQAFALASSARQADMLRRVHMQLAEQGWGQKIGPTARAAVIRYCFEIGADPARHANVLGGTIFINGAYYREAIAEHPDYLFPEEPEWIHDDKRLSEAERDARRQKRIIHGTPDSDLACCVVRIHMKGPGGVERVIPGVGRARAEGRPDPVGKESPRETAETRAWRECGEKIVGAWLKSHPQLKSSESIIASARIVDAAEGEDLPRDPGAERQRLLAESNAGSTASGPPTADPQVEDAGQPATPSKPKTVKHQPNAICGEDDYHPASECKLESAR